MSDKTELYIDSPPKIDPEPPREGPVEHDPQFETRQRIAEKYEARMLAEIQEGRERMGLPREEPEEPESESGRYGEPRDAPQQQPQQAPYQQQPQAQPPAPQLYPLQTPDDRWHHVTAEQAAQLAQIGAGYVQQQSQPQQQQARPPYQEPQRRAGLDPERAKAIAQSLSFGTTDEQAAALQEYAQLIQPQHGPQEVSQAAARQVRAEMQLENNLAIIGREYSEIFHDPVLTQVAAVQLHQLRSDPRSAGMDDLSQYRHACEIVRSRMGGGQRSQPAAASGNGGGNDRLERKRSAPSIPVASDRRMVMQEDAAPREQTASEVIAQMRRARGQS